MSSDIIEDDIAVISKPSLGPSFLSQAFTFSPSFSISAMVCFLCSSLKVMPASVNALLFCYGILKYLILSGKF